MNIRKEWATNYSSVNNDNPYTTYGDIFYTREETISDVQENFNIRRYNSSEGYEVECENVKYWVLIQSHTNPLNEKKEDKKMHFPLSFNVQRGSIIKWLKYDENWLAMSKVDIVGDAYKSVQIDKCNHILKYNYNGVDINTPCIIEEDTNMTLDNNNTIQTPHSYFIVTISENAETNKIPLGARLIFKNSVYKLIGNNDISNNGLLKLRIALDEKRPTDNFVTGYADNANLVTDNYSLSITNGNSSITMGNTLQINAQLLNNSNVVSNPQLLYNSSDESVAIVSNTGLITSIGFGNCVITVSYANDTTIKSNINLTVDAIPIIDNYSINVSGSTSIILNLQQTYTATIMNNGTNITDKIINWGISDLSGNPTAIAIISSYTGTNCVVKANNNNLKGYVRLRAILSDMPNIYKDFNIQIKTSF